MTEKSTQVETQSFHYFGYGSLVNVNTRKSGSVALPVSLQGWVRQWRHRARGERCASALTIAPLENSTIEGVIVQERIDNRAALDRREAGYFRETLQPAALRLYESGSQADGRVSLPDSEVVAYRSMADNCHWASNEFPVNQSYIDCVLAGYLEVFGESGLQNFIDTTQGWGLPVIDDRANPLYPRAVVLSDKLLARFDQMIDEKVARLLHC